MNKNLFFVLTLASGLTFAQDAKAVLEKAATALGKADSIQYTGSGKAGTLGQSHLPTVAWPTLNINSYTRTIDYASNSSREEMVRTLETPPAKGGGAPFVGEQRQVNIVSGQYAWNQPGNAPQPAAAAAEERYLNILATPHGFVRGALANNATAKKAGANTQVSYTVMTHHKIVGTIDAQGMVTDVSFWIPNPVLGDMEVKTTFTGYKDFGGVKFPTKITQTQGGYMVSDVNVTDAKINVANAALTVPDAVKNAAPPPPVTVETVKLGDGAWWLGGGSHHSIVLDYKDYIVVMEGPLSEARSLAVIAEAKKLVPNKPIRYLINTHHHFDHSSGVRTFVAEGATIITSEENKPYYEKAWKMPRTLDPDNLAKNKKAAKFITVKDKYVLSDGTRTLELYRNTGDNHNGAILFGYLPKEKVLIEADDFTPPAPNQTLVPLAKSFGEGLYDTLQKLKLDIQTIAPLHGRVVPYAEMPKALGKG